MAVDRQKTQHKLPLNSQWFQLPQRIADSFDIFRKINVTSHYTQEQCDLIPNTDTLQSPHQFGNLANYPTPFAKDHRIFIFLLTVLFMDNFRLGIYSKSWNEDFTHNPIPTNPDIDKLRELKVQILLQEHALLRGRITGIIENSDKYFTTALTLISGSFIFAIEKDVTLIFAITPFALLATYALAMSMNYVSLVLGAHSRIIEDRLNAISETTLIDWGSGCPKYIHNHNPLIIFYTISVVYVLIVDIYCLYQVHIFVLTHGDHSSLSVAFVVYCTVLLIATAVVTTTGIKLPSKQRDVYIELANKQDSYTSSTTQQIQQYIHHIASPIISRLQHWLSQKPVK